MLARDPRRDRHRGDARHRERHGRRAAGRVAGGWGVGVVVGQGINAVGVAPDGRRARFAALGAISGDRGGGSGLGMDALGAAVRAQDGRGPRTVLERPSRRTSACGARST